MVEVPRQFGVGLSAATEALGTSEAERAVSFRFTVKWSTLSVLLETPKTAPPAAPPPPAAVVLMNDRTKLPPGPRETPPPAPPQPLALARTERFEEPAAAAGKKTGPAASIQWEMVVPKMVRSAKRAGPAEVEAGDSPRPQLASSQTSRRERSSNTAVATIPENTQTPNLYTGTSWLRGSLGIKLGIGILAIAAAVAPLWLRSGSSSNPSKPIEVEASMGGGGWMREPVSRLEAGFKQSRQLVFYRPSLSATDARMEFTWNLSSPSVGWIFRAKDRSNYYAMRVKVLKPGPSPTLGVEHFTVFNGAEGLRSEKVLILSRNDPTLRIRMEIAGPAFTLYMQGSAFEYWNDTRLTVGALGFFEEWNQASDIQSVRMTFFQKARSHPEQLRDIFALNHVSGGA